MKFEQMMVHLEGEKNHIDLQKVNIFHRYRKAMKVLDDAPPHDAEFTQHVYNLSCKYL